MLSKHLKFRFFWNLFIFIDNIWIKTKNWLLDLYFRKKTLVLCVLYVKSGLIQREERRYDVYFSGLRYPCFPLNLAPFIFPNNQSSNFITSSIGIISASLVQLALVSFSSLLLSIFFSAILRRNNKQTTDIWLRSNSAKVHGIINVTTQLSWGGKCSLTEAILNAIGDRGTWFLMGVAKHIHVSASCPASVPSTMWLCDGSCSERA